MFEEYELVEVPRLKPGEFSRRVRRKFNRMNLDPLDKIMEVYDASGVRWYYNQKNLRKRKGGEII